MQQLWQSLAQKRRGVSVDKPLRLVVFGKTGSGKSATCNTILGGKAFHVAEGVTSVSSQCQKEIKLLHGRFVSVVDTPGVQQTDKCPKYVAREISRCKRLSSPGPHAILFVISLQNRFTSRDFATYTMLKKMFGKDVVRYVIVVFTFADHFDTSFDRHLKQASNILKVVLRETGNRSVVFNNNGDKACLKRQVQDLMTSVKRLIEDNTPKLYLDTADTKTEVMNEVEYEDGELIQDVVEKMRYVEKIVNLAMIACPLLGMRKKYYKKLFTAIIAGLREAQRVCCTPLPEEQGQCINCASWFVLGFVCLFVVGLLVFLLSRYL